MEMGYCGSDKKMGFFARVWYWIKGLPERLTDKVFEIARKAKKVGKDDPRRVIHSLKVGLALTIVSLFYYFQPLYDSFGVSAMWAVMTVVVVFEFSVGATLGKGLNRAMATLAAGALGVGVHHIASVSGKIGEPILLGLFVFVQASTSSFVRFFPKIKARYDYGMLIFILTFCLVAVSGFRDDEILDLAKKRLSTILIGSSACVIVSIFVCPVWAGGDLHNLVALNMEKLGIFLEGFGDEYFRTSEDHEVSKDDKSFMQAYRSVLNSKSNEEALANFARWEPGHGQIMFRHPWKQYLKVGTLTRQCACQIEALNGYINSDIQGSSEIRGKVQETCTEMSLECGKALNQLAMAIKTMTRPSLADLHIANSKSAAKNLKSLLKSVLWEDTDLLEVVPVATVASLLLDIVTSVEEISDSVNALASLANFKTVDLNLTEQKISGKMVTQMDCPQVVVIVDELPLVFQENDNSSAPGTSAKRIEV